MFIEPKITRVPSWVHMTWYKKIVLQNMEECLERYLQRKQAYYKNSHKKLHIKTNVYN